MKNIKNIFSFLLLGLTALTTLTANAWGEPVYWPASGRIPAKLRETWVEFDNIRLRTYTLTIAGGKIEVSYLGGFAVGENDPRYNATFVIAEQPSVRMGISAFAKGDFLTAVNATALGKYIDGLKASRAENILGTTEGTLEDTLMINGIQPEIVEYTLDKVHRREYFVETASKIFVLTYEAPEKLFDSEADNARIVFSRVRFL